MIGKTLPIVLAAATLAAAIAPASAQTPARPQSQQQNKARRHAQPVALASFQGERPPLTVNKRSFLDPGPVVPVGTMQNYVTISTTFNRTPDQVAQRSLYGNETLPWPLEIPGRSVSIIEFDTPALDY